MTTAKREPNLQDFMKAVERMAGDMYISEVVETEMESLLIGEGKEFRDREEWIQTKIGEYLDWQVE